jgi:hypothetical protein
MRKNLQRFKNDDRKASFAPARSERALSEAELDQVAAAGGKVGSSANPVED